MLRRFEVAYAKPLTRRNVRATACFHADANAPAGSQRQHMPFTVTTFPVKMRLERSAERDKREYKNNFSAIYGQSETAAILDIMLLVTRCTVGSVSFDKK